MSNNDDIPVSVVSGFGHASKRGFVPLVIGDHKGHFFRSAEARRVATLLFEAADAADGDAFLMSFAREKIGVEESSAAGLMVEFREWRKAQRREEDE